MWKLCVKHQLPLSHGYNIRLHRTGINRTLRRDFNVLFFGRDTFSSVVFNELRQAKDVVDLLMVVTTPDQWVGRRRQNLSVAPLKQLAESIQVPVFHIPENKDELVHWTPPIPFDEPANGNVLVTASFGKRIPGSCLSLFCRGRKLNVHPSLLPKYRGAAPIQHALLDGVDKTGVSIIEMEDGKGFDFGDIWAQQTMNVPQGSTYMSLEPRLAGLGGQLLIDVLRKAKSDASFAACPQNHSQATKARLIKTEQSEINWAIWSAERVERTHRAIGHQRPVFTYMPDKHASRLQLLEMRPAVESEKKPVLNMPGQTLFEPSDNTLRIYCAEGTQLVVSRLKTENKNALKAKEWWNGVPSIWLKDGLLHLGLPHNAKA
ncbi:unnamed protein product [Rhizoctonia solani]|uniref:Methionyl-tRNA formyltransferase, mitochondrial n=1 Tax=Rhizoctonia solani TaxID=456999 RepID=A0A8H3E7K1_9AGAM|nr:unnamed protein product [Rhizoctonia solani]